MRDESLWVSAENLSDAIGVPKGVELQAKQKIGMTKHISVMTTVWKEGYSKRERDSPVC